jgi:hypothetical protein
MQTLAGFVDRCAQCFEADRRVDQIAQDGLARGRVAGERGIDRLSKQRLAEPRVALGAGRSGRLGFEGRHHTLPRASF